MQTLKRHFVDEQACADFDGTEETNYHVTRPCHLLLACILQSAVLRATDDQGFLDVKVIFTLAFQVA